MSDYNRPYLKTQALYLNDTLVTSTAAELNLLDGITSVLDEDAMGSNSPTSLATQQSIKAYVDSGRHVFLEGEIADVSAAASSWVVSPVAGDIIAAYVVIDGAITVGDAAVTFEIGGVAATGTVTIANAGSAAGSTFSATLSGTNTVTAGGAIEIITDGNSTDPAKGTVVIVVEGVPSTPLRYIKGEIADISSAGSSWVVSPIAGNITNIWTVIDGAITTVDAGISFEIGGTAITGGGITIAFSGSAAGIVDTAAPTALNTVTAGGAIEIITDGNSTNAVKAGVLFEITP